MKPHITLALASAGVLVAGPLLAWLLVKAIDVAAERRWCREQPGVSLELHGPPTQEVIERCLR